MLFESVLFRFYSFYFLSRTILLQLQVILGTNIWKITSWSKRKAIWSWFGTKIWRFCAKIQTQPVPWRHSPCLEGFQRSKPTKKVGTARASSGTAVRDLQTAFCCFCFFDKPSILVYFWPKAHGFLCNTLVIYFLGLKSLLGYK